MRKLSRGTHVMQWAKFWAGYMAGVLVISPFIWMLGKRALARSEGDSESLLVAIGGTILSILASVPISIYFANKSGKETKRLIYQQLRVTPGYGTEFTLPPFEEWTGGISWRLSGTSTGTSSASLAELTVGRKTEK